MSQINHSVTNEQVIPVVESSVFDEREANQFAVGIIAVGEQAMPGMDDEFKAYLRLRANVYADQTNMISRELVKEDGTETDEDDARSVHFAVFENADDQARVVGAMRLIIKSSEDDRLLPVEDFFDDAFKDKPAPLNSTEVSRYICRHEDRRTEKNLKWLLYTKALGYIMTHDLGPTFGVVEPALERGLSATGVPVKRIADPKFVPEYAADNLGIQIDTDKLAVIMGIGDENAKEMLRSNEYEFDFSGLHTAAEVVA